MFDHAKAWLTSLPWWAPLATAGAGFVVGLIL